MRLQTNFTFISDLPNEQSCVFRLKTASNHLFISYRYSFKNILFFLNKYNFKEEGIIFSLFSFMLILYKKRLQGKFISLIESSTFYKINLPKTDYLI